MAKHHTDWTVLDHDELRTHAENLWTVDGALPDMPLGRRMTLIRRADGTLVVHNAIALRDEVAKQVDELGPVGLIVVPNGWHRLDAAPFLARYPDAAVACPRGAREKVEQVVPVDQTFDELAPCASLRFGHVGGVQEMEGYLVVTSADGTTLVLNDAVFNLPNMTGVFGLIYGRLMGNAGGPRVTSISRLTLVKDKAAFRNQLRELSELEGLRRLIVSHGDIIEGGVGEVLQQLAATWRATLPDAA